ncbi:MAG: potassium-transporting ATPase subunit KdpA [Roseiflexus sp.]|nr:potassium-transporting ATPase subunit KdpA [Roseiflexus sp.]
MRLASRPSVRSPARPRPMPAALRLVIGLAVLVAAGTSILMLPWMGTERPLTWNEALFTAVSALSVTGLSIITPVHDLSLAGQIVLLLLIQIGGVGFMVVAVIVFQVLGRRITLTDRLALTDSMGLLVPGAIVQLVRRVLLTVLLLEAIGAALLWIHWRDMLGPERALLYAIFHAVSAFCNAGFDLFTGLPDYPYGIPNDSITLAILGSLIFLGGLGIPVLAELLTFWRIRFSLHTRITLTVVIILVSIGAGGLFLTEQQSGHLLEREPLDRQIALALFQSISTRTAGFSALQPLDELSPAGRLLTIILMFIGCAPASMGGGITTGTFAVLMLAVGAYARGLASPQIGGRTLAPQTVRKAAAILTVSLLVVLTATWLILVTHEATLDDALFEVVSAFATCGLSLTLTSELNLFGQLVICVMMFWGRLGALTLVVALANQRPQLVAYPEEQVLIG